MAFYPQIFFPGKGEGGLRGEKNRKRGSGSPRAGTRSTFIKKFSRYALQHNLMVIAYWIARLYFLTIRIESENEETVREHLRNGGKVLAAIWHQRIISVIGYAVRFGLYRPAVMISGSRDGDLIADMFSHLKFRPVRGSSSHNGRKALAAMVDDLKIHPFAVHVLDGPKGPPGVIKPGLIVLARHSGVPVTPVYIAVNRAWVLKSWDRMVVPKPFSRVMIRWDQPISIPADDGAREFEDTRLAIERRMLENQRRDDGRFGWNNLI
ncbi:MAG: lysophospholipid acyltransferase family protein [Syntrophaceae bacterium]|nr:lysophospholipid acyltransferase family protein [Syntrophaceae bacterium]